MQCELVLFYELGLDVVAATVVVPRARQMLLEHDVLSGELQIKVVFCSVCFVCVRSPLRSSTEASLWRQHAFDLPSFLRRYVRG